MTFRTFSTIQTRITENLTDVSSSSTSNNAYILTDTTNSYKATLNIFSSSVETYNTTVNSTASLGPIGFDCYDVIATASSANFNNRLSFVQSSGSALPNWLTFDRSTANVSISSPSEVSNNTYTITNTYSGSIVSSFSLETNAVISVIEEVVINTTDQSSSTNTSSSTTSNSTTNSTTSNNENIEDVGHCLNAPSDAVCGVYIALIELVLFIVVDVLLVCLVRKLKNKFQINQSSKRVRPDEDEPDSIQDMSVPTVDKRLEILNLEVTGIGMKIHQEDEKA